MTYLGYYASKGTYIFWAWDVSGYLHPASLADSTARFKSLAWGKHSFTLSC